MREEILKAFNEQYENNCTDPEIIFDNFDTSEILETWLNYNGIYGYAEKIIDVLMECGWQAE